ncbi:hypothetical protein BX616_002974, partial [Lobosporangium transversale]
MTAHSESSPLLHSKPNANDTPYTPSTLTSSSTVVSASPEATKDRTTAVAAALQRHQETRGLFYMTLSALFFSFMSLLVSLTAKTIPSFEIVFFRGVVQTFLGVIACRCLNVSPFGNKGVRFLLFCRGLAGSCGLGFFFYALSVMPLADATVIFFLGPVFTAILGRIVLKEPFGPLDMLASVVSMIGVILVAKPSVLFHQDPKSFSDNSSSAVMMMLLQRQGEDHHRLYGALAGICGA